MLPVSEDDHRVRVILRQPSALVNSNSEEGVSVEGENGSVQKVRWYGDGERKVEGQKQGLYEWVCSVGAGRKIALQTAWDVKAAADLKWIESS